MTNKNKGRNLMVAGLAGIVLAWGGLMYECCVPKAKENHRIPLEVLYATGGVLSLLAYGEGYYRREN